MLKTLIVSGGNVNEQFIKEYIQKNQFSNIIAVDKGLEILDKLNIMPNHIVGDFDSVDMNILEKYSSNIHKLEPEKDYTDTHIGVKLAIELNSNEITIIGAIGSRLDHSIANIHIMHECLEKNISCKILNENNEIILINKKTNIEKDNKYKYISLIPLTTYAKGISLKGFKYILQNATLKIGESIGISNEQLRENTTIEIKEGILIIIKSKD